MKKITKLLSVLLAIAVIICPMMSAVVVNAEGTGNGYSLTRVDATNLRLTIDSTDGFLVYQATVELADTTVSTFSLESYTVKNPATNDSYNYPTITSHQDGKNVTFIVASTDANCLDLYTQVKINFTVTSGTTAKLTKIQAADDGDVNTDPTLLNFPGVNNPSNGEIDQNDEYAEEHAAPATHTHAAATTIAAQAATCVAKGTYGYVTCSCGKVFTDGTFAQETTIVAREIPIDPDAHTWGAWEYNNDATHLKDGTETRTCTLNSEHTETQDRTGTCLVDDHTYVYYAEGEKTDTTHTLKCECGATKTEGHTFVEGFCSVCEYEEPAPAHEHVYGDLQYKVDAEGKCVTYKACECGNEQIIASLDSKTISPNPVLAAGLSIRFRVKTNTLTGYSDIYCDFTKDMYSGNTLTGQSDVEKIDAIIQGTNNQFEYAGIASNEMTSTIHIKLYGTDANGDKLLIGYKEYALADYFKEKINDTSGVYSDDYKNFFADVLRYGSYAQLYAGYHTDLLPTTDFDLNGFGTDLPTSFPNSVAPTSGITITPNVVLGNRIMFRIRFAKSDVQNATDLKLTVSYKDEYGKDKVATGTLSDFTSATGGKNWQYEFSDLCCAFVNDYITIKVLDGTTELGSIQYSFQKYADSAVTNYGTSTDPTYSNMAKLCQACCAYSSSAKKALGIS